MNSKIVLSKWCRNITLHFSSTLQQIPTKY